MKAYCPTVAMCSGEVDLCRLGLIYLSSVEVDCWSGVLSNNYYV